MYVSETMSEGTSMAMESSENGTDYSQDDTGTIDETSGDIILSRQTSVNLIPYIGQKFMSQEAAYEFYCSFAKQCGFSIRRHRTRGKDGVGRGVTRRDFTCHRGGYPQLKPSEDGKMQRNRKSSRCGCQAYMRIVKRSDFNVPEWRVTGFSNVHNHELLKSNDLHLLPSYCAISSDDKSRICMLAKAGMSVRQMLRLMELEKGVKLGCLPFTELDVRNLLQTFRNVNQDNDVIDLITMCKKLKDENQNFKYDFKIDGNNRLEHIAWSYASSVQLYEAFGDALIFDTTHRLDAYDMLFGIWIGVDNNGMTCFFGCVLLRNEDIQSFSWALRTFLHFMKGKVPQTILSDQNLWLKEAIAVEMPSSKHGFCIWHIIAKLSDWFSLLLGPSYDEWKANFYRLYNLHFVEDFEEGWCEMLNRFGLHSNKHIVSLYALRTFWALPFLRPYFFAGMMNTCQSDSNNAFVQQVLGAQAQLDYFVERVEGIVRAKPKQDTKRNNQVLLKTGSPIESHAATVLTPYAFGKLQDELVLAPQYASFLIDDSCFQVRHHTQVDGGCKVIWDPCQEHICCSCHEFEFSGILCRHVLRVLSTNNCFRIPDQYFPSRWRSSSSTSRHNYEKIQFLESMASTLLTEATETDERLDTACEQISLVLSRIRDLPAPTTSSNAYYCQSDSLILPEVEDSDRIVQSFTAGTMHDDSITMEKLKERELKDGVDVSRKSRHCLGPCYGHFRNDASDCAVMITDNVNGEALEYL